MQKIHNSILKHGITPNEFHVLFNLKNNLPLPEVFDKEKYLRILELGGFIKKISELGPNSVWVVLKKGDTVINEVLQLISNTTVKSTIKVDTEFNKNVEIYLSIFPKKKLPSGKQARADSKNIETAFVWFFKNYKYTWEIILEATSRYVHEYELKGYMYMQTSQYFIRKQQSDKTWNSELANMCSLIVSGQSDEDDQHYSEKVV